MTNNRATDERIAEIEAAAREAREVLERLESVCASKHGWSVTKTQQEQTKYLIAAARYLKAERERVLELEEKLYAVTLVARSVMRTLEKHGPPIVSYLLDSDSNNGELLRQLTGLSEHKLEDSLTEIVDKYEYLESLEQSRED